MLAAFQACSAPGAYADVLREALPPSPSATEQQRLGAALVRASRFDEAAERLVPVADAAPEDPKAAWLAGFALWSAGSRTAALPYLRRGESAGDPRDAALFLGTALLEAGDVEGAIAQLEAGRATAPQDPALPAALARAYGAAGREQEAAAAASAAAELHRRLSQQQARRSKSAALGNALNAAWAVKDLAEAERIVDRMWPDAPPAMRKQLLGFRVEIYEQTGRAEQAAAARAALAASP